MTHIISYLKNDELSFDKNVVWHLRAKAARFTILDGRQLLRRFFSGPYLKYVTPTEASYILAELH